MSTDCVSESRVYARHARKRGAVLIVGAGAVGGFLAEELSRLGISPLCLVDRDVLAVENLVRHPLGCPDLDQPKASSVANQIRREFPLCDATGIDADFLKLSEDDQVRLAHEADLVVAATDTLECQRRINEVCLEAEVTAVYPGVWGPEAGTRDAEVGEILWVLPGNNTPCYQCFTKWRPESDNTAAARGTRADIQIVVLATVQVIAALLDRHDERSRILDDERTLVLVRGFMPSISDTVRELFRDRDDSGLLNLRVPFPSTACTVCGSRAGHPQPPRRIAERSLRRWFDTVGIGRPNGRIKYSEESTGDITTSWVFGDHQYFARYSADYDRLSVEIQIAASNGIGWKSPRMYLVNTREQLEIALAADRRRRSGLSDW